MKILDLVQGSPEWFQARLGIPTASNFDKIVTADGSPSKQADKYIYQLAGEWASGQPEENGFKSQAMTNGTEREAEARQFYEFTTGVTVKRVGFCITENFPICGASPDGLIEECGGLEIKCPMAATHVSYSLKSELPMEYWQQVQGNILVTGSKWWDFMSYYPGMKPFLTRVYPDDNFLNLLKCGLETFCTKLEEVKQKIK